MDMHRISTPTFEGSIPSWRATNIGDTVML